MVLSSKKRARSKSHIVSNGNDDRKALGEVLNRSTKTKQKKKSSNHSIDLDHQTPSIDSDIAINISPSIKEEPIIYRSQCLCETHYIKQLLERTYQLPVDKLFDLIFGSNEFVQTYRQAQRFYDDTATEWIRNEVTNCRERTLKYKVPYESTFIGKGTILTRENQTLFQEVPGSHYTLETEVYNTGVKFCDTFSLILRYCLVQTSLTTTNLRVTAQVIYNKSVNGFIKQIIERNAYSASQEGLKDLNNRLNLLSNFKMEKRRASQAEITSTIPTTEIIRHINQQETSPIQQVLLNTTTNNNYQSSDSDQTLHILIFLVFILFCTHIYLYTRLKQTDFLLEKLLFLLKI